MASNLRSSRVRAGSSAGEAVMLIHRPNVDTNLTWLISWLDLQLVFMMRQFHFQSLTWHCQSFDVRFLFVVIKKTFASQVCQLPFLVLSVSFLVLWRFFNQASGLPVVSRWFLQSAKSSTAKGISKRCSHVAVGISIDRVGFRSLAAPARKIRWAGGEATCRSIGNTDNVTGNSYLVFWQDVKVLWTMFGDVFCSNGVQTWQNPNQTALTRSIEEDELVRLLN